MVVNFVFGGKRLLYFHNFLEVNRKISAKVQICFTKDSCVYTIQFSYAYVCISSFLCFHIKFVLSMFDWRIYE